ncbi:putative MFS family arabinose efflux permease [Planifilum fimeticola]|uniref:Putative MFS family arabinose efflux permease n=1 Tax=Planifilum fimeticola TaxID=201975 RepID=A0A2T0LBC8_9BACL|nr:putative MFS family arabinose efflux permease [Planifilum fimeticola]
MNRRLMGSVVLFCVGVFMGALDNGIISAALTTLIDSFDVTATWGSWTVTIYTLGMAISIPIVGKMSDKYGIKKLFLIEIFLFGLGSLLVASSFNFGMFLVARLIQSLGGGGIFIIASSYILRSFPVEKQGGALGMLGAMHGIASVLGPNAGSFILSVTGSWHWLFLINIPIAVILLILGFKVIQDPEMDDAVQKTDWAGIGLLSFALLSLMYSFTLLEGVDLLESMASPEFLLFAGAGIVLLVALGFVERRMEASRDVDPLLPVTLLRDASYRWTLVLALLSGAILASVIFIPAYIEQYLGVDRNLSGYWVTPLAIASGVGAGAGGAVVDRRGPIQALLVATVLTVIGFLLFPLWVNSLWQMVVASCLVGVGFGFMLGAPINVLAAEKAGNQKGIALATSSLLRQIGMTLAPTVYAGFIARSFLNLEDTIKKKMEDANIPVGGNMAHPTGEEMDVAAMQEAFDKIPDPTVREILSSSLHEAVETGYSGLFYASTTVAIAMLLAVILLGLVRRKAARQEA